MLRLMLADADLIADNSMRVRLASASRACLLQPIAGCSLCGQWQPLFEVPTSQQVLNFAVSHRGSAGQPVKRATDA